jgi:hypothetical protein
VSICNVVEIVGLVHNSNKNIIDIDYWKCKFRSFVKYNSEIVKRTVVKVLRYFEDINLLIEIFDDIKDEGRFVYENLIETCFKLDANNKLSIDAIVLGIKKGYWHIRENLYLINDNSSIKYLLSKLSEDSSFLNKFIENEYFEGKYDIKIIENSSLSWDNDIERLVYQILENMLKDNGGFFIRSNFLIELSKLINNKSNDFLLYLLKEVYEKQINSYIAYNICSRIIKLSQVSKLIECANKYNLSFLVIQILQGSKFNGNEDGEKIYEEGRKYFYNEYEDIEKQRKENINNENIEKQNLYETFRYKLQPEPGKYQTDVFQFVINNFNQLNIDSDDYIRLKELIIGEIFECIDPINESVVITERSNNGRSYNISLSMKLFGDCIKLAHILNIDVQKHRKKIIAFIPWTMNETLDSIFTLIPNPSEEEVNELLSIYASTRNDDLNEFNPFSFIKAYKKYKIKEAVPILKQFIQNDNINISDKISALTALSENIKDKEYFSYLFNKFKSDKNSLVFEIAEVSNRILIDKYSDKDSIIWRIQIIRDNAFVFDPVKSDNLYTVRTISNEESELTYKKFASPIMCIKDEKYKDLYLGLLNFSFTLVKKDQKYNSYCKYIWDIVLKYFENLKDTGNSKHLINLEMWIQENSTKLEDINWFKYRIQELRRIYLNETDKPKSIIECIIRYNELKKNLYLRITSSRDLLEYIRQVINEDLKKWVEFEGAYKFIEKSKGDQETMIQKTIKTQFENALLRRGFMNVGIIREAQLLDDIRPDFIISYGFVGSVVVEIKRVVNSQIKNEEEREKYIEKLVHYIEGTKSDYLIYLIFNTKKEDELETYTRKIQECYRNDLRIFVEGLDCV